MPILKQAKKRVRQTQVKKARNYNVRVAIKKAIRSVNDSVKEAKQSDAEKNLSSAFKVIDTAVKKNILKKNTGARRKSSLAKKVSDLKKPSA